MKNFIYPVILCGGSGTRLWPVSRKSYPKQFTSFRGKESLFQSTVQRFNGETFAAPSIVTSEDFRFVVSEQLAFLENEPLNIFIEPSSRNTAAAICIAAISINEKFGDSILLISPSDHIFTDDDNFCATVLAAKSVAEDGQIVTFGIRPDRPETGYGWLELSTKLKEDCNQVPQKLISFVEKPDLEKAKSLFVSKNYLWNSGVFLFSTSTILEAFKKYAPEILNKVKSSFYKAEFDLGFTRIHPEMWEKLENISIDHAIMERASNLFVIPYYGGWSDLGDWKAVWRESKTDTIGNVSSGSSTAIDCHNTFLQATSENQELVAIGLKDIIAVSMPDAVLVAHKDHAQTVKKAVETLKDKGVSQAENLQRDYRPWGWYESLALGERFKVKFIVVNPGGALSLQSHQYRAEHWIILKGTAKVTINGDVTTLTENQSIFIPNGAIHRIENCEKSKLNLIEVQTGSHFGEEDIIRYEDIYGRVKIKQK